MSKVFNDSVAIYTLEKVDSLSELSKLPSTKLIELQKYFATDKARHSDKILTIASETVAAIQMRKVISLVTSAVASFEQCFSSDLWQKAMVDDAFDPAEFRCILRLVEAKAKDMG